jgi:tetratricopeptide (TPR) repeat protein
MPAGAPSPPPGGPPTLAVMTDLDARMDEIFAARDRDRMQPTIDAFERLLADHPDNPRVVYEVGGSYDTAGEEETAVDFYTRALELGLEGRLRRQCLLQLASTLRQLNRFEESLGMLDGAIAEFPDSPSLPIWKAFTLHAAGYPNAGFALLLDTIADHLDSPEIARYEAALRGNADYIRSLDDE